MNADTPPRRTRFNPDLRCLFAAQAFSSIGDSLLQIAAVIIIYRVTGSAAQVAVLYAVMILPATIGMFLGPVIARFPQRTLLIVCDLARAVVLAVAPALVVSSDLVAFYAGLVVVSVLGTAFQSSRMTVMASAAHGTPLSRVNGFDSTTVMVGQFFGLAAGGGLVVVDYRWALWIDAGTFVVSAAFLARLTVGRAAPGGGSRTNLVRALRDSYGYIVRTAVLSYNIFGNTLFNLGAGIFASMMVVYCYRQLHTGSVGYMAMEISGLLGITLGGAALAYLLRPLRLGSVMFVGYAVTGAAIAALGLTDLVSVAVVLGFVVGVASVVATSISRTMLMAASSGEQRLNVMSVRMSLGRPVNTLGAALGAALAAWVSMAAVMYVAGMAVLAFAVLGLLVPALRTFQEQEADEQAPQSAEQGMERAVHA